MKEILGCRADFPILQRQVDDKPLVYLDSAATAQRPYAVLDAMDHFYRHTSANPHRGVYRLAEEATAAYENARKTVADFIGVKSADEVIFTAGTTASLNLLAYTLAPLVLQKGDSVVIPVSEHHSNLVPWQRATAAAGAELRYLYLDDDTGQVLDDEIESKITRGTKIVAFAHVSNVLGNRLPAEKMIARAHAVGAVAVMDCAQSVPHLPLSLAALDVDFAAFSAHKLYGPMGGGVLYGKQEWLEALPPFMSGGDMIEYVEEQQTTFAPPPLKFEAGTQYVAGAVGLAAAIRYVQQFGWDAVKAHESALMHYALAALAQLPYIKVLGNADANGERYGVISFTVEGVHPHDVATILDTEGVAIRAGHHCAQPLMKYLGINASCRASFGIYNTFADIDALAGALQKSRRWLGYAG